MKGKAEYVYRVQDARGSGPFKPRFSRRWSDHVEGARPPTWMEEFGPVHLRVPPNRWAGSACRTLEQLRVWFSRTEYMRLQALGYCAMRLQVDRILAESRWQLFVERARPFEEGAEPVILYP